MHAPGGGRSSFFLRFASRFLPTEVGALPLPPLLLRCRETLASCVFGICRAPRRVRLVRNENDGSASPLPHHCFPTFGSFEQTESVSCTETQRVRPCARCCRSDVRFSPPRPSPVWSR
eukprot:6765819-Prymnesium_polylepis.1